MKILAAFACVLSINVASAELVVYEGAGIPEIYDPLNLVAEPLEMRFRIILDTAAPTRPVAPGVAYINVVRDLKIWLDDVPYVLGPTSASELAVRNDCCDDASIDDVQLGWAGRNDTVFFRFSFFLSDFGRHATIPKTEAAMLSSEAVPIAVDFSLADMAAARLEISHEPLFRIDSEIYATHLASFTITPLSVVNLLQDLRTASEGVGPGRALANKVILAQTYYAVPDLVSTCAVLVDYVLQTAHKKVPAAQGAALAEDARLITSAIGCE